VRAWLLVIAWAAVIFAFSSVPNLSMLRKLAHAAEFAVLGALLVRAPGREGPAWTLGVLYSASDELRRRVVAGRNAAPFDVVIDAADVGLGMLVGRARWLRATM
jgi:VanZ family protein